MNVDKRYKEELKNILYNIPESISYVENVERWMLEEVLKISYEIEWVCGAGLEYDNVNM